MPKIQKKKTSLKESLKQHQARQQVAKRQAEGREKAYVRKDVMSANQKKVKRVVAGVVEDGKGKGKVVIPFGKDDKLLLIGEGTSRYSSQLFSGYTV